ncbi:MULTISPECIES: hypothetical protein [unclassified Halomonas]|uniref:hypothetical protein n=1 Tax=unclassified Halomonas TaxID=2609666 RepID=UPI0028869D78|nr:MULTISPECIES: hypothetical protein [unclassified Halomonas]MDT0501059.1 hypothetical protein [Halomonas sp. PAR7]MDT0513250.1 hypothetical protein [Halomonas sp. LES1]MDT0592238.1 hypothetical protein [Halomonas sp. PAR8]
MNSRAFRQGTASRLRWGCATALFLAAGSQAATLSTEVLAEAPETPTHQYYGTASLHDVDRLYAEVSRSRGAQDGFYRGTVIADEEMGQMRAGFKIGALDADFGARLQTMIDDRVELVSVVNFTQAGPSIVSQTLRDPGGVAAQVGNGTLSVTDVTPGSVDLTGLADFSGIALNDTKGFTSALHNITREAIVSGVVSNASNRHIQQRIDISVRLNNIGALDAARKRAAILDSFSGILR